MGMFDNLKCLYPLPVTGLNTEIFQTKDTPAQMLDMYEIRKEGTLWHEDYDVEDRSDPNAEGIERLFGSCTKVNKRWEFEDKFIGEIRFYTYLEHKDHNNKEDEWNDDLWYEFSAYFVNGRLICLLQIPTK